jgi:hypothetical protein
MNSFQLPHAQTDSPTMRAGVTIITRAARASGNRISIAVLDLDFHFLAEFSLGTLRHFDHGQVADQGNGDDEFKHFVAGKHGHFGLEVARALVLTPAERAK